MFGSEILEIAIGIAFIFVPLSFVASTLPETIEGMLKMGRLRHYRNARVKRGGPALLVNPAIAGARARCWPIL